MRLPKVGAAGSVRRALLFAIVRLSSGFRLSDVVRTLGYRPEFFGAHQGRLTQAVMRGESAWSVGERELFAAFVSRQYQCVF